MYAVIVDHASKIPENIDRAIVFIRRYNNRISKIIKELYDRGIAISVLGYGEVLASMPGIIDFVANIIVVLDAASPIVYSRIHGEGAWRMLRSFVRKAVDSGVLVSAYVDVRGIGYGEGVAFVDVARRLGVQYMHYSVSGREDEWYHILSFLEGVADTGARAVSASDPVIASAIDVEPVEYPLYSIAVGGRRFAPTPRLLASPEWSTVKHADHVVKRFRELHKRVWPREDPERVALYGHDPYVKLAEKRVPFRKTVGYSELEHYMPTVTFKIRR